MPVERNEKGTRLSVLALLCFCLICCAIPGAIALIVLNHEFSSWPKVDALVIGTSECHDSNSDSQKTYAIIYNYTTLDGEHITATTDYCSNPVPNVNETERIIYDPDDPHFILDEKLLDIGFYAARSTAGVGWICIAIIAFVIAVKRFYTPVIKNHGTQTTATNQEPDAKPNGPAGDFGNSLGQEPGRFHTGDPSAPSQPAANSDPYSQSHGPGGDFGNSLGQPSPQAYQSPSATATPVTYDSSGRPVEYGSSEQV
eukprot:scaffold2047_cov129-Cylindrotheca_fusiformis.AAC.13